MPAGIYTRVHAPFETQFWSRVNKDGPLHPYVPEFGSCWIWTGSRECGGYGAFRSVKYGRYQAHRLAWKVATGDDTAIAILHSCDNRLCVRNDTEGYYEVNGVTLPRRGHLFQGNRTINAADKVAKGRATGGRWIDRRKNVKTKLTETDIPIIIRMVDDGASRQDVANVFGISAVMVGYIYTRKCWSHVDV